MSTLALPNTRAPFLDENGNISRVWWAFLNDLFNRVGGGTNIDLTAITNLLSSLTISVGGDKIDAAFSDTGSALAELAKSVEDLLRQMSGDTAAIAELAKRLDDIGSQLSDASAIAGLRANLSDLEARLELDISPPFPSVPQFTAPTLLNSWVNFGGAFNPAGYYKDPFGVVHLRGLVKSGVVANPICTLPAGYRPTNTELIATASNALFGIALIDNAGNITVNVGSNVYFSLDNLTFRAA